MSLAKTKRSARLSVGLLAPEMCTRGGVQSFMWRIAEVIHSLALDGYVDGFLFSLNDTDDDLRAQPNAPCNLRLYGAGRNRVELARRMLWSAPPLDVLIVGHIGPAPLALGLRCAGRVGRYHLILHGIEAWSRSGFMIRTAARYADRIVATTRFTASEYSRHNQIPSEKFEVIPLCADERDVEPSKGLQLNGSFKLLCVARMDATERYKGIEHLFEALACLRAEVPGIHLNLIGEGTDRGRLEAVAGRLNVADQVTFWGQLPPADLAAAYDHCDVFVMPSLREGFGIVFLEAMRRGKPCIGGRHGGTPEVIKDGESGFLVRFGDVTTLARYISMLSRDHQLAAQLGLRGQELLKTRFSATEFRKAYRRLILGHGL
jgi:phosphatidylinositol alpha-1,6-mannosyltransferase